MNAAVQFPPGAGKRFNADRASFDIGSSAEFLLTSEIRYLTNIGVAANEPAKEIYMQKGLETDLASIPWFVQWWLKRLGKHNLAALVHDYLLEWHHLYPEYSRKQIDKIFHEAMIDLGVSRIKAQAMYRGVRVDAFWQALKAVNLNGLLDGILGRDKR